MAKYLLIGPSGIGKSTVLKGLAEYDDIDTYDLDRMLEEHSGMNLTQYVAEVGWEGFFNTTRELIDGLVSDNEIIIAVGAGSIEHMGSHDWYKEQETIALIGRPDVIYARCNRQQYHPTLESYETVEYSAWRRALYNGVKHKIDVTRLSPDEVVEAVLNIIDGEDDD